MADRLSIEKKRIYDKDLAARAGQSALLAHPVPPSIRGAMSTQHPDSAVAAADHGGRRLPKMMAIAMILLAMVGAAVTLADAAWARTYWLALVPIFGVMCTIAAWDDARAVDRMVVRQILHWLSVGLAIILDFNFLQARGEQTAAATGLSSLLILALGCLLAGIHLDWLFAVVGLLLLLMVVLVSIAQEYLALVFLLGVLIIALLLGAQWLARRFS